MKSLFKLSSVALAVLTMASCADDLGLVENAGGRITDTSKLTGILADGNVTRTGMVDYNNDSKGPNYPIVWSKDDVVNVYSLTDKLTFSTYDLASGDGEQVAEFDVRANANNIVLGEDNDLYAVTSSQWVYGLSAKQDGTVQRPLLTAKIPTEYTWDETPVEMELATNEIGAKEFYYYTNDAPYWGPVDADNGKMNVKFRKLMGAIKIDIAMLKKGTKAIVIASKNPDQPLSGTFNALLNPAKTDEDCKLKKDDQLVNYNLIRANLPKAAQDALNKDGFDEEANRMIFIIPLIAQSYDELDVIAIKYDEGETGFIGGTDAANIPAAGTVVNRGVEGPDWYRIRTYTDRTITVDTPIAAYPAVEQEFDGLTPMEISEKIALAYDELHDFIFTIKNLKLDNSYEIKGGNGVGDLPIAKLGNDNTIYIPTNIDFDGKNKIGPDTTRRVGSITLNFDETLNNTQTEKHLYIKEAKVNLTNRAKGLVTDTKNEANDTRGEIIGTVGTTANEVAFTSANDAAIQTAASASGNYERKVSINLSPLATADAAETMPVDVYLPTSRVTMGLYHTVNGYKYGAIENTDTFGVVKIVGEKTNNIDNNKKTAGVNIEGGYAKVEVLTKHSGGVIAKGKDVEIDELNITNHYAGLVRIDDASVKDLNYLFQEVNQYVYTVGSAAMGTLTDQSNKVRVRAFWTGKALTEDQYKTLATDDKIENEYEQKVIYTAAQLASMAKAAKQYEYEISEKVSQMHLGGTTYPWPGATVAAGTNDFKLEGHGVGLRSMVLKGNGVEGQGLINSITAKGVTIDNIDLYQAVLNEGTKDNVGAVVGLIDAAGAVAFGGSQFSVKEIDLTSTKDNVGGIFGNIRTATDVEVKPTTLILEIATVNGKNNVGGLGGIVTTSTKVEMPNTTTATVTASGNITASANNAGGVFGSVTANDSYSMLSDLTFTGKAITAGSINAGGVAGYYHVENINLANVANFATSTKKLNVTAEAISVGEKNVGGLVGNADKGDFNVAGSTGAVAVKVTSEMSGAYHVGGLVGLCNDVANIKGVSGGTVTADIAKFSNTWTADKFNTTELKLVCGTFGGFIGKANVSVTIGNKEYNKAVNTLIEEDNATKKALHFQVNKLEEKDAYGRDLFYWGDTNNYVGYVVEGYDYIINSSKQTVNSAYNRFMNY